MRSDWSGMKKTDSALVEAVSMNFLGVGFGVKAGCQANSETVFGMRTGGKDPISCSSKQSSSMTLVVKDESSAPAARPVDAGNETVAEECETDECKTFLLEESTGIGGFVGEGLRPASRS